MWIRCKCCNDKQRLNSDKCRCECKDLIDKGRCDDGFIWDPSICECDCDKSCDADKYLEYVNCKCRKSLTDKIVEKVMNILMKIKWFIMRLCTITKSMQIL